MKMQSIHLVLAAALAIGVSSAQAAEEKTKPMRTGESHAESHGPTASSERQFSGKISGINREKKTITIEDKQSGRETLHIGSDTRVMRGKESAGWEQLRDGEEVRATARRSGEMNHALSVEIAR